MFLADTVFKFHKTKALAVFWKILGKHPMDIERMERKTSDRHLFQDGI
jgi:hypothetical protein